MRRALLAAALVWLAGAAPAEPGALSPAAFRDRIAAAVEAATHRPVAKVDDRTLRASGTDGAELTLNIDSAYADYLSDPANVDAVVARYARILTTPVDETPAVDQLVVIVRPSDYAAQAMGAANGRLLPARPMAGDLSYFLAVDAPDTIRLAAPSDLKHWRIDEAEAWRLATAHIKTRVGALQPIRMGSEDGPSGFGAESGLAPSILADPAVCSAAKPEGLGGQIVLVVGRDTFLYAVPSDADATRTFWTAARRAIGEGRTLSSTPLTCHGGRWAVAPIPAP